MAKSSTTNRTPAPANRAPALVPDAILAPYSPPSEYVVSITDDMSVSDLRQQAEHVTTAVDRAGRRFVRDTVTAWGSVGMVIDAIGRRHGSRDGGPLAAGVAPSWAEAKRAMHHSPDIAKRPTGKGTDVEATIGGWGERTLSVCFDAFRSGAGERYGRWSQLCDEQAVVTSAPALFKPNDAKSLIGWSLADTALPKRTDAAGKVIASGSNRAGTGRNVETTRLTVAEVAEADRAERETEHLQRVDILTGDPKVRVAGTVTVSAVTKLSDEGLKRLVAFALSEIKRRKDAPTAPVVDAGAEAAKTEAETAKAS